MCDHYYYIQFNFNNEIYVARYIRVRILVYVYLLVNNAYQGSMFPQSACI